jgi:diguanylate cyclase (GGDEF)-like protein
VLRWRIANAYGNTIDRIFVKFVCRRKCASDAPKPRAKWRARLVHISSISYDELVSFELKLAFLRELDAGHKKALAAHDRLLRQPWDRQAIDDLFLFFHRIAGTAESVEFPLLGRLAGVCEGLTQLVKERIVTAPDKVLPMLGDGLAGVTAVLDQHRMTPLDLPQGRSFVEPQGMTQPAWTGDERVLSKVLVIDDDPFSAGLIDGCLRSAGFISTTCTEPEKALDTVNAELPDLVILDVVMPNLDGFELCRQVRAHPALQFTPIIFVTRKGDLQQRVRGLEVGGNDYIAKPFEPEELIARVRSHLQRLSALREIAIRDGLTRCYNHKYFKVRLAQEIARAKRYRAPLTLGILDVDRFKEVNDRYGHIAGDAVLAHLSGLVVASVRSTDVVARYGGEEFGLLLVQSAAEEASIVTNRLRERVAKQRFPLPDLPNVETSHPIDIPVTVSIGVAQMIPEDDLESFVHRADMALYEAKAAGRNQVRVVLTPFPPGTGIG